MTPVVCPTPQCPLQAADFTTVTVQQNIHHSMIYSSGAKCKFCLEGGARGNIINIRNHNVSAPKCIYLQLWAVTDSRDSV